MAPASSTRRSLASLALLIVLIGAALPQAVYAAALSDSSAVQDLTSFVSSVSDGNRKVLRGVYAAGTFALPVVQQTYAAEVSRAPETATQFGMAQNYGVVGLLAHNYLSGQEFFELTVGQSISLVYGDGRVEAFRVTRILQFQATIPESANSGFINLDTGKGTDAEGLFRQVYMGSRHVTFQTCIEQAGDSSWGRLFVIAEPAASVSVGGATQ
jgi:hypothetical protein